MAATHVTRPSLLVRVQSADDEAWREFESMYGGLIIRYCRRCGLGMPDAEDVSQVVLAGLARSLRRFEYDPARGRFRDYLGRCVRNAVASFFSSHKRSVPAVSLSEVAPPAIDEDRLDSLWQEQWRRHHYRRAMRTLRTVVDERSLAIFDALLQGRDQREIEAEFSTTPAAVRKVKQRMRDRLRELIASQIQDEELPARQPGS